MIVRVTVLLEALGYLWTIDADLADVNADQIQAHGWIRGSSVISVVDSNGVGFPKHAWEALISDPMKKAELQTKLEATIRDELAAYGRP